MIPKKVRYLKILKHWAVNLNWYSICDHLTCDFAYICCIIHIDIENILVYYYDNNFNHTVHFPNNINKSVLFFKLWKYTFLTNVQAKKPMSFFSLPSNINGIGQHSPCLSPLTETPLSHPAHSALPQSENIVLNWKKRRLFRASPPWERGQGKNKK